MAVEVDEARAGDRAVIASLLDDYLRELVGHREIAVGATDARSYPHLDAYFAEPGRHPFLIRREGQIVGFALIRDPASTGGVWQVAECYVAPASRRAGIGHAAVADLWRRFPGPGELQVHARNTSARRFWEVCAAASAQAAPA